MINRNPTLSLWTGIEYVIFTDKMHIWMLIYDTDEGMMMLWICVGEYWIGGLKISDIYEWI